MQQLRPQPRAEVASQGLYLGDVIAAHVESAGTKAYTVGELRRLFAAFRTCSAKPVITVADTSDWPVWISRFFPDEWGWFVTLSAEK